MGPSFRRNRRHPRLYEFTEPVTPPGQNTSGSNIIFTEWKAGLLTTYQPNPFHGIDRMVFAIDEWAHRRGMGAAGGSGHKSFAPWAWYLTPFPYICNWWDRRLVK